MSPRQDVDVARPGLRPCPHGSYNLWQPDRRGIARGSGCVPRPLSLDLFREPGLHPSGSSPACYPPQPCLLLPRLLSASATPP